METVTVTNTGDVPVNFSSGSITGPNANDFYFSKTTCSAAIAPQAKCTATFVFRPSAAGPRSATLTVVDNATGNSQSILLAGIARQALSSLAVSQPAYDFGVSTTMP